MINLLPDSEKKELLKIEKRKIQIIILFLMNFFLICFLLVFLFLNIYFASEIKSKEILIKELSNLQEPLEIKEKTIKINEEIININNFYRDKIYYTSALNEIFNLMPEGSYLNNLSFINNKVSLSGFALTRDDLLLFKERLEENFKEVNFPPSDWVKKESINFSVTFLYD